MEVDVALDGGRLTHQHDVFAPAVDVGGGGQGVTVVGEGSSAEYSCHPRV